jgi:transcription elongation factor GreA
MQVPHRRKETYVKPKPDPYLTEAKFIELKNKLERLKNQIRPREAEEVKRLAEMGDFSENVGYQVAKGRLRGINQRILDIEDHLKNAIIFRPNKDTEIVQIGHQITIENISDQRRKTYTILGSSETNPTAGVISHNSPIGAALIGHRVGERIKIKLADKEKEFEILKIE